MIVDISEAAGNAALDTIADLMDGGSIEMLDAAGDILCELALSDPAAQAASGGTISFNEIAEAAALASGEVTTGRVVGADGSEVFLCDVGLASSDAVIKLNTTQITEGAPVRIDTFVLTLPVARPDNEYDTPEALIG